METAVSLQPSAPVPGGMDLRVAASQDDLNCLHMDLKQLQVSQSNHAERLMRLERRQADDAAIKAAWSPFPGILATTPQVGMAMSHGAGRDGSGLSLTCRATGPVSVPPDDDDLDDYENHLMSSLHLPPAEEEPVRRGQASRANSVRFDESALQGSGWGGQSTRQSGEFVRPGSGLSMERSFSHKSDGRHSSAGHSVHSAPSVGRASSVGGDASFGGDDEDSPLSIPEPPPGLSALGSVPSIIRCWLTDKFAHDTLLYADVCTGSRRSSIEYPLLRALDIAEDVEIGFDGSPRITLLVYLAEAIVTHQATRSRSPSHEIHIPSMTVTFEVLGKDQAEVGDAMKGVRIFIGSDALRAHSADVLLSRNLIVLYGNDRSKLSVPFVRPEDENSFKHICTVNLQAEKLKLNAAAAPFVSGDQKPVILSGKISPITASGGLDHSPGPDERNEGEIALKDQMVSPTISQPLPNKVSFSSLRSPRPESESGHDARMKEAPRSEPSDGGRETVVSSNGTEGPEPRRDATPGIWGSWRQGTVSGAEVGRDGGPLSGYQPAATRGRNMKVLKPLKSASSSARTGQAYEQPPPPRTSGEQRRKSGASEAGASTGGTVRWDAKRVASASNVGEKAALGPVAPPTPASKDGKAQGLPKSANPIGGASAFSWMAKKPTNGE
ncbi:hypothetical protein IMZ48_16450 [Candidatus Bathyarchaeota archaeon]|nr:hypothetical protein [Candidatus Bathyarchaeota archaeon]